MSAVFVLVSICITSLTLWHYKQEGWSNMHRGLSTTLIDVICTPLTVCYLLCTCAVAVTAVRYHIKAYRVVA